MWIQIADQKVRHLWECPKCEYHEYIEPWFYSEMGEPMCSECDGDMEYICTETDV